jgi:hypothetical protein
MNRRPWDLVLQRVAAAQKDQHHTIAAVGLCKLNAVDPSYRLKEPGFNSFTLTWFQAFACKNHLCRYTAAVAGLSLRFREMDDAVGEMQRLVEQQTAVTVGGLSSGGWEKRRKKRKTKRIKEHILTKKGL